MRDWKFRFNKIRKRGLHLAKDRELRTLTSPEKTKICRDIITCLQVRHLSSEQFFLELLRLHSLLRYLDFGMLFQNLSMLLRIIATQEGMNEHIYPCTQHVVWNWMQQTKDYV